MKRKDSVKQKYATKTNFQYFTILSNDFTKKVEKSIAIFFET